MFYSLLSSPAQQLIKHSPCLFFFPKYSLKIEHFSLHNMQAGYLLNHVIAVAVSVTPNMLTKLTDFLSLNYLLSYS